jgi:hypothetical protein
LVLAMELSHWGNGDEVDPTLALTRLG